MRIYLKLADHSIGLIAAIIAAIMFAATIAIIKISADMGAIGILGVRLFLGTCFLSIIMMCFYQHEALLLSKRIKENAGYLVLAASLLGTAFFLFAWAFLNGYGTSVGQSYLLLPFTMTLSGLFFFKEKLSRLQYIGMGIATLGIGHELYRHGAISWLTLIQTSALTIYFLMHRYLHKRHLTSMQLLVIEFWLLLPGAIFAIYSQIEKIAPYLTHPSGILIILLLGIITTVAYSAYIISNKYLSCTAFGMWSNLDPILIMAASVWLFGEKISSTELLFTYMPMLIGTVLVSLKTKNH